MYYAVRLSLDILTTIYFPLGVIFLLFVSFKKRNIDFYIMNIKYYKMLVDAEDKFNINGKIFSEHWLESICNMGFKKGEESVDFLSYFRFSSKIKDVLISGEVLEVIIIAKNSKCDFYAGKIDQLIDSFYLNYKNSKKVKKQIIYQFKKYDELNESSKNEIERIVCYKNQRNYLISLTIGYCEKNDEIYYLCPKKDYANGFYYYACQFIKKICHVKGVKSES
jgi:hypothetical protein